MQRTGAFHCNLKLNQFLVSESSSSCLDSRWPLTCSLKTSVCKSLFRIAQLHSRYSNKSSCSLQLPCYSWPTSSWILFIHCVHYLPLHPLPSTLPFMIMFSRPWLPQIWPQQMSFCDFTAFRSCCLSLTATSISLSGDLCKKPITFSQRLHDKCIDRILFKWYWSH